MSAALQNKRNALRWAMVIGLLASLLIDLHLTRKYGGVDLRDKIVGSRSLMDGRSLYYDPWRPGDPEQFADPSLPPGTAMTRYTCTPFEALIMAPIAALPYGTARLAWLFLQYALLAAALFPVVRAFGRDDPGRAALVAAIVLLVMVASRSWRLHVERGQVYVIVAAVLAALFVSLKARRDVLSGMLVAVLVLIKPTYAVIAAPLVLVASRRVWYGGAGFLAATAGAFALIPGGLRSWAEYVAAMRAWSGYVGKGVPPVVGNANYAYPATIEGMTNMGTHNPMEFENGSITAILHAYKLNLPGWMPWALYALVVVAIAVAAGKRLRNLPASDLLLLGYCLWTILMWLLPVPRFDYQAVQWTAPLAVLLLTRRERPFLWNLLAVAAAALLLGAWAILPVNELLAEMIMVGLVGFALWRRLNFRPGSFEFPANSDSTRS